MAGFNIEEFKGEVEGRNGILKSSRFLFTIGIPPIMATAGIDSRTISFWCEATTLPGYQLMMGDTRRWSYGPHEKRPYGPNIISLQAVFLSDGDGEILKFFQTWLNNIIPHQVPGAMLAPAKDAPGMIPYEVRYKQFYASDIQVSQFREDGTEVLRYIIKEAFPSNILDVPVSWEAANQHLKFQVIFEYLDWYYDDIVTGSISSTNPDIPLK